MRGDPVVTVGELETQVETQLAPSPSGIGGIVREFLRRLGQGELGSLPVVLGLASVWIYFQVANSSFLSSGNLTNLMLQIAAVGTISIGVVMVLLVGEIDLSVAQVSGLSAATMGVLNVTHGWSAVSSIGVGLVVGMGVGLIQGLWVAKLRVPSFVVTLAGLLAWQGAMLRILGDTGTYNLTDDTITGLVGTFFSDTVGWALAVVAMGTSVTTVVVRRRRAATAGLPAAPLHRDLAWLSVVSAAVIVAVTVFNDDRGLPLAVVIFIGLVVAFDVLTRRTVLGRHMFAVGGNAEAARRAGIRVDRIRITAFVLASTLAATGGILDASRQLAVNKSSGGGDLLLMAIGGAVIGGTSLFGGRGSAWSALLGALVIGSIDNGMNLLGHPSDVKFMVTGAVLLLAASVDAVSRRGRQAAGRA